MMVCGSLLSAEMRPESSFCTLCPFPRPLVLQGGRTLPCRGRAGDALAAPLGAPAVLGGLWPFFQQQKLTSAGKPEVRQAGQTSQGEFHNDKWNKSPIPPALP